MTPCLFWDYGSHDVNDRGRSAWRSGWKLYQRQGQEKKGVLQDALFVYFGNERHRLGGEYTGGYGILDLLGNVTEPPGQNVIQMIVDMMVSHTVHNKVRPFFLTEKGSVEDQEEAEGMMKAVEGIFQTEGLYDKLGLTVCKLGYIADGGFVMVVTDYARKKVTLSLVLPHEWLVPPREARKGDPRQGFYVRPVPRSMLLEEYGWEVVDGKRVKTEHYDVIAELRNLPRDLTEGSVEDDEISDDILVMDAFHLPSGYVDLDDETAFGLGENEDGEQEILPDVDPCHDGRKMVIIGGDESGCHVLCDEPYPYDEFPVCEFFPSRNPVGYGSRGVPETLAAGQLAVNRYNRRIENIIHFHAVPRLVAWTMARLNLNKITNDFADILQSKVPANQAAQYLQPPGVPPELLNRVDKLIQWMKSQYGVNDMSLSGEKPPGLDHAPGMEHLLEETTLRHTEKFEAWNLFHTKLARRVVEACRMLALDDPKFEIFWGDNHELKKIRWRDVELSRKAFITKIWPTSLLPQTPGMKMRRLAELQAMGAMTPQQTQAALVKEYPDIEKLAGDTGAAEKNIRSKLDDCAKTGYSEANMPHPYMNLELAKLLATEKINALESDGASPGAVDSVVQWWETANELLLRATATQVQAQAGAAPPPGPVPGDPGAPMVPPPPMPGAPPGAPPLPPM